MGLEKLMEEFGEAGMMCTRIVRRRMVLCTIIYRYSQTETREATRGIVNSEDNDDRLE